jgi:MFS family permease
VLATGYVAAGLAPSLLFYALAQGVLIGMLGSAAAFGPLMADASLWFRRRRGIAVALAASGNYLAGAVWPPVLTALIERAWLAHRACRDRRRLPGHHAAAGAAAARARARPAPGALRPAMPGPTGRSASRATG